MSKRTRPWTRRQRKAIRRKTRPRPENPWKDADVFAAGAYLGVFSEDFLTEAARLQEIAREVGGTFTLADSAEDVGDLFAVRKREPADEMTVKRMEKSGAGMSAEDYARAVQTGELPPGMDWT